MVAGGAVKGALAVVIENTLVNCRLPPAPCTRLSCTPACSAGLSSTPTEMTAALAAQEMQGARGSDAASDSICGGAVGLVAQTRRSARSPCALSMSRHSVLGYLVGSCVAPRAFWCVRDNFGLTAPGRPGCVGGVLRRSGDHYRPQTFFFLRFFCFYHPPKVAPRPYNTNIYVS